MPLARAWVLALGVACARPPAARAPDLVVILADDLDVPTLSAGLDAGLFPSIASEFVAPGLGFAESFVNFSQCCPSRATLLTGRYAHNHGVLSNLGKDGGFQAFDDRSTLATWLDDAGWSTALVGKYLNGYDDPAIVPPGWDRWRALVGPSSYCMYDWTHSHDGTPVTHGASEADYQTDELATLAADALRDAASDPTEPPIFLLATPLAPHLEAACNPTGIRPAPRHAGTVDLPLPRPPSLNEPDLSDKPTWMAALAPIDLAALEALYRGRLEAVRAVDDLVGEIVLALEETGRLDQAVLVFTSDNGFLLGEHRWLNKVLPYENSVRVPLWIRGPGLRSGTSSALVGNPDLAPTLLALAGVLPGAEVDGTALTPVLQGLPVAWRESLLLQHPPADLADPESPPYRAIRTVDGWVYVETTGEDGVTVTDLELYDLGSDPDQLASLHSDPAFDAVREALAAHLDALRECAGAGCAEAEWAQ